MAVDGTARSWFCVLNNPAEHNFTGSPEEIAEKICDAWMDANPQRTCAVAYCISAEGLHHCHTVFEDTKTMRFSVVKKLFPSMHIEPTKGNKEQAEDYINKRGKFEEKGEQVLYLARRGEIKGFQGQRKDFAVIDELIQSGKTPSEIMETSFAYRRYDKMIRDAYFHKRCSETPSVRDVVVYWHVGISGSGKSYTFVQLEDVHGIGKVYRVNDYDHGFDRYCGESILFMDEFRGQMRYQLLLNLLDRYKADVPCRYTNAVALWNEVHITSVLPPEAVYRNMVRENQNLDTIDQLKRRIDYVVFHWREGDDYKSFEQPMNEYTNYEDLKSLATSEIPVEFIQNKMEGV